MSKSQAIAIRLQEVFLDGKWIANTNYKDQIEQVTWQQAIQKVGDLNTISLLTFHITYYLKGILQVFNGGALDIRDQYSFDMPEITNEDAWQKLVIDFLDNAEQFVKKVEAMDDSVFDEPFVEEKFGSYLRNIEGVIEHSYYHLGQISLIRKMIMR